MNTITLPIGQLARYIEEFRGEQLIDDTEVSLESYGLSIDSPQGIVPLTHFIKKEAMPMIDLTFNNGHRIKVATKHILQKNHTDVYVSDLVEGDLVNHRDNVVTVSQIDFAPNEDCFDISVPFPHLYYDTNGLIHHNTLITAALSCSVEKYGRSIVIVPNKSLVTQTEADYCNLQLDVGVYFGDRKDWGKKHTICTWQSLNNLLKDSQNGTAPCTIQEFIEDVVCVIVDEVHQAKAESLKSLLTGIFAHVPIRWGLTGTIPKEPYAYQSIFCGLGNLVGQLSAKELQDAGHLAQCHVNIMQLIDHAEYKDYQSELKYLTTNAERIAFIAKEIDKIKETGNTLILVDRIESGKMLQVELSTLFDLLKDKPTVAFVSGATKAKDRKEEYDEVATADGKVIVATYGVAAVGINIPRIFNLVLLEPGKSFTRVIQSIGRGIRKAEDKDHVQIWDITSSCKFSKRHLTERKKYYSDAKYPFTVNKVQWK
jgi:superfamily II DNA or RNA helicase